MRHSIVRAFLLSCTLLAPSEALACRNPPDPPEIKEEKADAIVLAVISDVQPTVGKWGKWVATASWRGKVLGEVSEREFQFEDNGPGSCYNYSKPKLGKHWVLFLRKNEGKYRVFPMPYWWANRSGDPRVRRLSKLMPLGPVRVPTADEARILDFAEPRVRLPDGGAQLEKYTRLYARSSAGTVRIRFFRSRTPQRFMLDYDEEMPNREACGCQLHEQFVDLEDLWQAGKLPPFNP